MSRKSIAHIRDPHPERQKLRVALCLPRRAAVSKQPLKKAVSKQRLAHWLVEAVALAYQSQGEPCPLGVRHLAELRAGRHQTPSQDSTISALSQFLPVCWVSNRREELAGVTLAAPFPLTRGYERLFLPQFSSPDSEPWWNPPSTTGSQTGRSSLTPGPVLVLARLGLRSAPVLG